jgi:hypothetical protein
MLVNPPPEFSIAATAVELQPLLSVIVTVYVPAARELKTSEPEILLLVCNVPVLFDHT